MAKATSKKEVPVRVEMSFSKNETTILDLIAKEEGRSRKNYCEYILKGIIKSYQEQKN